MSQPMSDFAYLHPQRFLQPHDPSMFHSTQPRPTSLSNKHTHTYLYIFSHKLHLPGQLIPLGRQLRKHLQNHLAVDRQVLVAQLIRGNLLRSELVLTPLHIPLQQSLHRHKPHALLIHLIVYTLFPPSIAYSPHQSPSNAYRTLPPTTRTTAKYPTP